MWIQIINKLKEVDNKYQLHVGGDFQDPRYFVYFNYIRKEMKIEDNFILHGWIDNVEEFLEDKDYILSTSIHEGHPYNILESMARGIKPIIHNYSGSKEQWPNELIYNTIDEAVEKITEQTYDSEGYRRFIEDNYSLEKQIDLIEKIINEEKTNFLFNHIKKDDLKYLKISYCMPVYNGEKFIKKSLGSILNQEIKPYELIIIDDASTDNSYTILQEYANKYNFIKLFRNEKNLGGEITHDLLVKEAKGDFVKILHQDDRLYNNYSLEITKVKNIHEYAFVVNDFTYITNKGVIYNYLKKIWENFNIDPNKLNKEELQKALLILGNYLGTPSNTIYNRKFLLKAGYVSDIEKFNEENDFRLTDYYIFLRLLNEGNALIIFKDLSYRYEHDKNVTATFLTSIRRVALFYQILSEFEHILNENEKRLAYSQALGRALYSINNCVNIEEKKKMVKYVLKNYKYVPPEIEAQLIKIL